MHANNRKRETGTAIVLVLVGALLALMIATTLILSVTSTAASE